MMIEKMQNEKKKIIRLSLSQFEDLTERITDCDNMDIYFIYLDISTR